MGLRWLGNKSWQDVTRDERFFCAHLFSLIRQGPKAFVSELTRLCPELTLNTDAAWEVGLEVVFYRDFCFQKAPKREDRPPCPSHKRTFDLVLFSDDCIVGIEAKVSEALPSGQLDIFSRDSERVATLLGPGSPRFSMLALLPSKQGSAPANVFVETITWADLAAFYRDDPILLRAERLYPKEELNVEEISDATWSPEEIRTFCNEVQLWVGCAGGPKFPRLEALCAGDPEAWCSERFRVNWTAAAPPNRNWMSRESFLARYESALSKR